MSGDKKTALVQLFRRRKKVFLLLFAIILAGAGWQVYKSSSTAKTQVLASATVKHGTVSKTLSATGIIKPEVGATVKIGSRSTGIIQKMHVRVGDAVTADQVIAEIDSRELEAVVAEAEASLSKARIEYDRIMVSYPLQIQEAEARVSSAKASAEYAKLSYKRQLELTGRNLDSQNNLDAALEKTVNSEQALAVANATLTRLQEEFESQKASAAQSVVLSEASLGTAKIRLDYATIRTPMDGVVSQIAAQEGETVVAGLQVANLITVVDLSRKEMWVYIDENDIGQLEPGMKVDFRVDALPGRTFSGEVYRIYPEAEVRDSIVYYQTIVPLGREDSLALRSEMTTQCTVHVNEKTDVLMVPNDAIKWIDGRQVVFLVEGSVVKPVQVRFGMQGASTTEVLDGLKEGDIVATRVIIGADITADMVTAPAGPPMGGHPGSGGGGGGGGQRPR